MAQHQPSQGPCLMDEFPRCDQVTQANARGQGLGKGADVNHPSVIVETFQRRRRITDVVKLGFIIILDNYYVIGMGLFQQLKTAIPGLVTVLG